MPKKPAPFIILPFEERRLGLLEWLPEPLRFNLLPPEDEASLDGFALVPMPLLDEKQTGTWIYPLAGALGATVPGLRFELHPERFRTLRMTWNQGPSGLAGHPIELHAKYQLFEFDADAETGETLEFLPGETTLDLGEWTRRASLRVVQEIELLPAGDLPLIPSDTANPIAWDVWTPATSRRILLRRAMIASRTWPQTTDRTRFGPWYSWRDSYLRWPLHDPQPPTGPGVPEFPPLPPQFDPATQRLWPFHAFFRGVLQSLLSETETPGQPAPLTLYSIELSAGPVRGDVKANPDPKAPPAPPSAPGGGTVVNPFPKPRPTLPGFAGFLRANSADSDPHGWGILQRMGLAVTFRVRVRKTGNYVIGQPLARGLIQKHLAATFAQFPYPDVQNLKPYLHVESLFQPGARTELGLDETATGDAPAFNGLPRSFAWEPSSGAHATDALSDAHGHRRRSGHGVQAIADRNDRRGVVPHPDRHAGHPDAVDEGRRRGARADHAKGWPARYAASRQARPGGHRRGHEARRHCAAGRDRAVVPAGRLGRRILHHPRRGPLVDRRQCAHRHHRPRESDAEGGMGAVRTVSQGRPRRPRVAAACERERHEQHARLARPLLR